MKINTIVSPSYVDGPGRRCTLFVQGCSLHCQGCQNVHLWDPYGGYEAAAEETACTLVRTGLPITISGGEPFDQPKELNRMVSTIRRLAPDRHIIIYSGYMLIDLLRTGNADVLNVLAKADVLVDGPYVPELDAPEMQYRGSTNQRVIDLRATCEMPLEEITKEGPVLLDWDTDELILTADGDLMGAAPIALDFSAIGIIGPARRCGETDYASV
jgi:anaerobic ribonucleoside-triphosphate reductase activating protein